MKNREVLFIVLLPIISLFSLILPVSAAAPPPDDRSINHSAMVLNMPQGNVTPMVAAGGAHTVGLKSNGTVVAAGSNEYGQCEVSGWTNIVQVAAGGTHTVGLKSDGTVMAVGSNEYGRCNVSGWTNIVQVAAGQAHTVGLQSDGTAVAVGDNGGGEPDIGNWANVKQVAAGRSYTVALKSDNTVVVVGARLESVEWNLGISTGATLTISSTGGGAVVSPGEGSFTYSSGTMVPLVAEPDAGCHFVKWTGDVGAIVDVNATTTIITMSGNYSVTADFAVDWGPVGGIIAGALAAVLAILYLRSREAELPKHHL